MKHKADDKKQEHEEYNVDQESGVGEWRSTEQEIDDNLFGRYENSNKQEHAQVEGEFAVSICCCRFIWPWPDGFDDFVWFIVI
jgi:hypothetical protein